MVQNAEQRSLSWYRARLGKITGSRVGDLFVKSKTKGEQFGKTAISYLNEIIRDQLLDPEIINDDDKFRDYIEKQYVTTKDMQYGIEMESVARDYYCQKTGYSISECPSVISKEFSFFASSPDGLEISKKKALEIKCLKSEKMTEYLINCHSAEDLKTINPTYYWQCISHMYVTEATSCDFIIYNPYIKNKLMILTLERNEEEINNLKEILKLANEKITELKSKI